MAVIVGSSRTTKDARSHGVGSCHSRKAGSGRLEVKFVERKADYSASSGSTDWTGVVAVVGEPQELQMLAVGSPDKQWAGRRCRTAEAQRTRVGADSTAGEPALVARCSLVEVHILLQPFHLPFEQWSVHLPSTAEV